MARLARDALEPTADCGEKRKLKTTFGRHMGVGVKGNIGDGVALSGEEMISLEVFFHDAESLVAFLHPVLERMLLQLTSASNHGEPKPGGAEVGFETVLLEKHPLQRFGPIDSVVRRERGAPRKVPEDRIGFRQIAA